MEKIKERISYVQSQLAAAGRNDGWVIQGMKEELIRLERKLSKLANKK
tara:strand:- start:355 stop:498 length:144 start_codon:yes stop_codon:yes gene_type:complete